MEKTLLNILLSKATLAKTVSRQALCCAASIGGLALLSPLALAADNNPALEALFQQADYWHSKNHDDLAKSALQKVLMADENNTNALYLLALYSQQSGDKVAAEKWRQRLSAVAPQDARISALEQGINAQPIYAGQLSTARQYAAHGDIANAVTSYRALFQGGQPPDTLAIEYYTTLAGLPAERENAITGLQQRLQLQPNDSATRLALGKIMTYQESTRRDGIHLLSNMAAQNPDVDAALKQALLWLSPLPEDQPLYDAYQQRHPQDKAVIAHYQDNRVGMAKNEAFNNLNHGNLPEAKQIFDSILAEHPKDADALAGEGFTAMRSGDFATAESYLDQAVKAAGNNSNSTQWVTLSKEAHFYSELDKAKQAVKENNYQQALTLSAPLAQETGDKGLAVNLFRADVMRRKGDLSGATQTYQNLLAKQPENNDVKLGLYYLLRQQNKNHDAEQLVKTIPAKLQPHTNTPIDVEPLRREASLAVKQNNPQRALNLLQQAREKQPDNPWVQLDMARILKTQGRPEQAEAITSRLTQTGATKDALYATALFLSENKQWDKAANLLDRIPVLGQTPDMRELAKTANFNLQMANADRYIQQDNSAAAAEILRPLTQHPPTTPDNVGHLAQDLMAVGDTAAAVQLVRKSMQEGVKGSVGDYAAQVSVLNQAGLTHEAQAWLNNPALQANSSSKDINQLRSNAIMNDADRLRLQGQYASAYDKLIVALQSDPKNPDLMLAMGRLYQSGKMNKEAAQVYNYLLSLNDQNVQAREGAINTALAMGDASRAKQLLPGLTGPRNPSQLLLAARVAEANGDHSQALALLRSAKGKLIGMGSVEGGGGSTVAGLPSADNPFANQTIASTTTARSAGNPSVYGVVLPWQVAQSSRVSTPPLAANNSLTNNNSANDDTIKQINALMTQIQDKTATWVQSTVSVRNNSSGEDGLSNLTEAKVPLEISGVPFDNTRVTLNVTPTSLNSGTPTGSANNRFGTGPLQQAQQVAAATQASAAAAQASAAAAQAAMINYQTLKVTQNALCSVDSLSPACLTATNNANAAYNEQQLTASQVTQPQTFNPNDFIALSPGSQKDAGTALGLALSGDSYKVDVGSTPLGAEMQSLLGGIQWSPKLDDNTTLTLTAERRAMVDSLLSYVGIKDGITGKNWGGVTKNGGKIGLSYDDGEAGAYASAGYYDYFGDNVEKNSSVEATVGLYVRPYHDENSETKTGANISYLNFSKNLSYFTYGQGGYFSPQDYFNVAFPIEYSQTNKDWSYKLSGNMGYQSYTQRESDYFPNNPDLQAQLVNYVNQGYSPQATYAAQNKSGFGYSLRAEGNYKINPSILIGGAIGYDTFGHYSESSAQIYLRYLLGRK